MTENQKSTEKRIITDLKMRNEMSDKHLSPSELNDRIEVAANEAALAEIVAAGFEKIDFDKINLGDTVYVPEHNSVRTVTDVPNRNGDYPLDHGYLLASRHKASVVYRHPAPSPTSILPAWHPRHTIARVHFKDGVAVCLMDGTGNWIAIGGGHLETEWDSPDVVAVYILHRPVNNTEPTLTTLRDNPGRIAVEQSGLRWMYSEGDFWFWRPDDNERTQSTIYRPEGSYMKGAVWADPNVTAPERKDYKEEPRYQDRIEQGDFKQH